MKNWGDSSSDEESDDGHHPSKANRGAAVHPETQNEAEALEEVHEDEAPALKTYNYPTEPPFTAYVGNLSYNIANHSQLTDAVTDLVHQRTQQDVRIVNSRIAWDRQADRARGFGYVEFETLEDLKLLMKLNDGQSSIEGRNVKLDVAQAPQKQPHHRQHRDARTNGDNSRVDGASFRAGRYARQASGSSQRQSSVASETSEPRQRPSLKLAPRTKPREGETLASTTTSSSSLFGGGKAREEDGGSRDQRQRRPSGSVGGRGGRGGERRPSAGRSGRSIGRGTGRGEGGREPAEGHGRSSAGRGGSVRGGKGKEDAVPPPKKVEEKPATKTIPSHVNQAADNGPNVSTKKVANKFAALLMDESDSE